MKAIVHIGATKTASSALQRYLYENRKALLAAGVCYPDIGVAANAHHLIAAALHGGAFNMHRDVLPAEPDARVALFERYMAAVLTAAEAAGAHTIVFSSEYLWGVMRPQLYSHWARALSGCDLYLYAVLRRPDQWLQSSYIQGLKSGLGDDFEAWFDNCIKAPTRGADHAAVLSGWAKGFAGDNITLRGYEDQIARDAVFNDALDVIGVSREAVAAPARELVNPSPSPDTLNLMKMVNRSDLSNEAKAKVRGLILRHMPQREIGSRLDIQSPQTSARVARFYAPIVARIIAEFGPHKTAFMQDYLNEMAVPDAS